MVATNHFRKRASERGIDRLSIIILYLYGENLDSRDGVILSHNVAQELRQLAYECRDNSRLGGQYDNSRRTINVVRERSH